MKMKITVISLLTVICLGCGQKKSQQDTARQASPAVPQKTVTAPVKAEEPKYKYLGVKFKDPFMPLIGGRRLKTTDEEIGEIDPASLSLKGILVDNKEKMATVVDTSGNSYIVKGKRLYNRKGEIIEGIVGIVKLESVVIITKDKTVRELKLKSEEEY